jgi:TatA/E family protein of Tat protein translocase
MGPIGYPEMVFIFVLALLLFGPKKLPELGKMLGKGLTEFNRAKNELKSTFDREMRDLERETQSIKEVTDSHYHDNYNYDYSSYDPGHEVAATSDLPALEPSTLGASATQGAESTHAITEPVAAPEGTIANGTYSHEGHPNTATTEPLPHTSHGEPAEQTTVKS